MEKIKHMIEIVNQSHRHMPALLLLFLGLIVIKKRPSVFFNDKDITGDNIPATLMDVLR